MPHAKALKLNLRPTHFPTLALEVGALLEKQTCSPLHHVSQGIHSPIDTPTLPVNHCNQSSAFGALKRKARGTRRDETTSYRGEKQHNVNSAGHTVTDGRYKSEGLVIAVLACAVRMNDPEKYTIQNKSRTNCSQTCQRQSFELNDLKF